MQNKPNLVRRRRIANSVCTTDYEIFIPLAGQKNKPNSNPIKANFRRAKMNINSFITKDYRKKDDFVVRINKPNSNPIYQRAKLMQSVYLQRIMKKMRIGAMKKQSQNKPNFKADNPNFQQFLKI